MGEIRPKSKSIKCGKSFGLNTTIERYAQVHNNMSQ